MWNVDFPSGPELECLRLSPWAGERFRVQTVINTPLAYIWYGFHFKMSFIFSIALTRMPMEREMNEILGRRHRQPIKNALHRHTNMETVQNKMKCGKEKGGRRWQGEVSIPQSRSNWEWLNENGKNGFNGIYTSLAHCYLHIRYHHEFEFGTYTHTHTMCSAPIRHSIAVEKHPG